MTPNQPKKRFIGVFLLAMLNLSVMVSLRNLPMVAEYGLGSSFLYLVVALVFLFPSALVSAELATGWSRTGGVYVWVREAFGPGWGFFAVWMQWVHNVTWFPAILSFSGAAVAYVIHPELASNKIYLISFILIGFWGFTIFNFFPLKTSSWFSALAVLLGTIVPGCILLYLGLDWLIQGNPSYISFSRHYVIPPLGNIQNLVFLTGLFLAFGGLEVSAVHARDVKNPQKNFPRAIIVSALIAFFLYSLGALSIAMMIPSNEINLVNGLMETFELFLKNTCLSWLFKPIALLLVLGAIGELNAWIVGPVRALHATSKHGDLPPIFQKLNRFKRPVALLLFQAIVVTFVSFVFLWMPSASSAFWILSALSAQLYLVMYFLMFLAAIKLRYSHPHVTREYRIPYKMPGIWLIGSLGALSSLFGFCMGFVPPLQLNVGSLWFYEGFLLTGIFSISAIPIWIYWKKNPSWLKVPIETDYNHPPEELHS